MESQLKTHDPVNHPLHYTSHPSGIECIQVAEHYGFNIGNCIKYLWRAGLKDDEIQDLEKAAWYLNREIEKRKSGEPDLPPLELPPLVVSSFNREKSLA